MKRSRPRQHVRMLKSGKHVIVNKGKRKVKKRKMKNFEKSLLESRKRHLDFLRNTQIPPLSSDEDELERVDREIKRYSKHFPEQDDYGIGFLTEAEVRKKLKKLGWEEK